MTDAKNTKHIHVTQRQDGSAALSVSDLNLNRPDDGTPLVQGLNLTLNPGDRLIISGASGSGKSTLIRAIRQLWESGDGHIDLPANARIITASQRAYMPTLSLKGVLSYPRPESEFYDIQIEKALRAVGHDRLVQFLPERQTHYIIDRVLEQIPSCLNGIADGITQEEKMTLLADSLCATIPRIVKANIDTAQPLSFQNERHLRQSLITALDSHVGHSVPRSQIEPIAAKISQELNRALVQKLADHLVKDVPALIEKYLGRIEHIDINRLNHFTDRVSEHLQENLRKSLTKAHVNPLCDAQCAEITNQVRQAIEKTLEPHFTWNFTMNKAGKWIGKLFNGAAEPLRNRDWLGTDRTSVMGRLTSVFTNATSATIDQTLHMARLPLLNSSAKKIATYLEGSAAFYLAREVVNGDVLSKRLSGGEQQRLVFARALLHHPDILILDEVTAALDKDAGIALYDEIVEKLPNTIIISVAHNMHVVKHHTLHGHLENKAINIKPVQP